MRTTRRNYDGSSQDRRDCSYRHGHVRQHRHNRSTEEVFKCRNCRRFIGPTLYGGHHRNHCPFCLYSRHVDVSKGDRQNACGSKMAPIGYFQRANGEYVLVHRCLGCDFERFNRIAADDNFDLVLQLPELPPRTVREMKLERIQSALESNFSAHDAE